MNAFLFILFLLQNSSVSVIVKSFYQNFHSAVSFSVTPSNGFAVIDQKSNSLIMLDHMFHEQKVVGGQGLGVYEFDNPTDVASSFLLETYVVDYNNRRIQKYDKQLNYVETFDENTLPTIPGRFSPVACAVSLQGDMFIVETDDKRIIKVNQRNGFEKEFGKYKDGAGALIEPKDIAISSLNEVIVLDKNRLLLYDIYGNYLSKIDLSNTAIWKSITISNDFIVVTSLTSIEIISTDRSLRRSIMLSDIIGLSSDTSLVDAALIDNELFILAKTTLYRCTIHW